MLAVILLERAIHGNSHVTRHIALLFTLHIAVMLSDDPLDITRRSRGVP